jgi:hypothetical protein
VGGVGPRFLLEALFLIAVAIGAGVAELSAAWIVAVMAAAWLVVCLFELAVWTEMRRVPALGRRTDEAEEAGEVETPPEAVEPDEITPPESVEPAAITEISEPESAPRRGRFWRRRAAS